MNHTPNYNLPQWELEDLIRMEDFNTAMGNIETGLDGAKAEAVEAKSIANFAKATATAAHTAATLPAYVVGTYSGNGGDVTVNVGFRPSFVIISGGRTTSGIGYQTLGSYDVITGGNAMSSCIRFTDTGFVLKKRGDNDYPKMTLGMAYDYIAFR